MSHIPVVISTKRRYTDTSIDLMWLQTLVQKRCSEKKKPYRNRWSGCRVMSGRDSPYIRISRIDSLFVLLHVWEENYRFRLKLTRCLGKYIIYIFLWIIVELICDVIRWLLGRRKSIDVISTFQQYLISAHFWFNLLCHFWCNNSSLEQLRYINLQLYFQ